MSEVIIQNCKVILPAAGEIRKSDLIIKDRRIKNIKPAGSEQGRRNTTIIDGRGFYLSPGFIDLQVNGGGKVDFLIPDAEGIEKFSKLWASKGTTSFLATIITNPIDSMRKDMKTFLQVNPDNFLGFHIEGPFLSMEKRGTHNPVHIMPPSKKNLGILTQGLEDKIKIVTFAPELPKALELIKGIQSIGVVPSIGHTNSTYDQAMKALEKGARAFTHLYNAMRGFHHRNPGCLGAALDSNTYVGLIADGHHVHPAAIRLALQAKGINKICLVTDAISAAGMEKGEYTLGDQKILVKEEIARLPDGTIAGSILTMNQAVKNFMEFTRVSLPQAVRAASLNPAKLLGIDDRKGSIEEGKDADLVIFDQDFNVHYTIIGGEVVYSRED